MPRKLWRSQGGRSLGLLFQSEPLYCDLLKSCPKSGFSCFRRKKKYLLTVGGIPSFVRGDTCDPEREGDFTRVTQHE